MDKRLVVEIDGAAYHSSAEAVERDRHRDSVLEDSGFEVLRIPAKTVLYSPKEAIELVEKARVVVRGEDREKGREVRDSFRPARVAKSLADAATAVGGSLDRAYDYLDRESEKIKEKHRIEIENKTEEDLRKIQEELDSDEELKKQFDALEELFNGKK